MAEQRVPGKFYHSAKKIYRVDAIYRDDTDEPNSAFQNNPNILALPKRLDEEGWIKRLTNYYQVTDADREHPAIVRLGLLENVKRFYQPLTIPLRLAMDLELMLWSSYVDRNPFDPVHIQNMLQLRDGFDVDDLRSDSDRQHLTATYHDEEIEDRNVEYYDDAGTTTSGITVMGVSGVGKTRAVNRILARIPQVITHRAYKDRVYPVKQVTYLKFDCPPGGTVLAFAEDALYALSEAVEYDYYSTYVSGRTNSRRILRGFLSMAIEHYLGMLIIDEIQNLVGSKEGRVLLNLLVKLRNDFHIPIVLIGTPSAEKVLTKEFRQMRRGYGYDEYNRWFQMKKSDKDWEIFVRALWKHRYTRKDDSCVSIEIINMLHHVSGGVADLAVKMFIAVQRRAIRTGTECISPALLKAVARDQYGWASEAVDALRLNTQQSLKRYEDLYFQEVKYPLLQSRRKSIPKSNGSRSNHARSHDDQNAEKSSIKTRSRKVKKKSKASNAELVRLVTTGREENKTAYQSLKDAGWIGDIGAYL